MSEKNGKIRVGIVGPGRIVDRVMPDLKKAEKIEVTAFASRSLERAENAANRYGVKLSFGSYAEMAASDEVDLVYIATPHPFHEDVTKLMLESGKAVLCEKPIAANNGETERMVACARKNNVFLMEAMWTRFLPAMKELKRLLADGAIGEIRHIDAAFSYAGGGVDEEDRVYNPDLAGGALLDLGVYPLMNITRILGTEPVSISGVSLKTPQNVDMRMAVQMIYAGGQTAQFFSGMDAGSDNLMTIYGSKGYIRVPESWRATSFTVYGADGTVTPYEFEPEFEGHHYEFDHAAECLMQGLKESPEVTLDESVKVSTLCTRLRMEQGIVYPFEK